MVFKHTTGNSESQSSGERAPRIGKDKKDSKGNVKPHNLL